MKLYDITQTILSLASIEPTINFVKEGDIYKILNNGDVSYPCCVLTQQQHTYDNLEGQITYNFNVFFVDRLLEDESNKLQGQSWATSCITNLCRRLEEAGVGIIDTVNINVFSESFEALCCGAYATLSITVDDESECAI